MDYTLTRRWELWVLFLTGLIWVAVGGDEGVLAFLLAAIPGGLLTTAGGAGLLFPGEPGATRVGALGAFIGVAYSVVMLVFEPGTALAMGGLSALSFVAAGRLGADDAEIPDSLEHPEVTVQTAAEVAVDETVLGALGMFMGVFNAGDQQRVGRELDQAVEWLDDLGDDARPEQWNRKPDEPAQPSFETRSHRGMIWEELCFESGFEPHEDAPGRDRYLAYTSNRHGHAWVLRRPDAKAWLVCVHGLGMGRPPLDMRLLDVRHFHEDLGLNVLMPVLPFHGPRRIGKVSGHGYMIGDVMNTLHAQSQAMWDIRRLLGWLDAQDAGPVGVLGMSLGGYTTALLAGLEDQLACVVAAIPAVSLSELGDYHASPRARRRARAEGITVERIARALAPVSPLAVAPRLAPERRFIYGGLLDRFVPPEQVLALWRHWEEPAIAWYPGAHLSFPLHHEVRGFVDRALRDTGLIGGGRP